MILSKYTKRYLRRVLWFLLAFMLLPYLLTPILVWLNPPISSVMVINRISGEAINRYWVDIDAFSPHLVRAVIASEDNLFCEHVGVDFTAARQLFSTWRQTGNMPRGVSTITMQTARNLFLWQGRGKITYVRKVLEVPLAMWMDLVLSKKRIMEIYLNIAQWDKGVYGIERAAQRYFNKPAERLTKNEAVALATTLPNPERRNPASMGRRHKAISAIIRKRTQDMAPYTACLF